MADFKKAIVYQDRLDGEEVHLLVPWGNQSGHVPPPRIEFSDKVFVYQGDYAVG